MATISLGMIVRNEERTLRAALESVAPFVDEIVIGLGGESTDSTEKIAREFTKNVFQIDWQDDFADARNQVLERCHGDYFLWIDGDDELINGDKIRQVIAANPNGDAFYFAYDYGQDETGNSICLLIRERIVRRGIPGREWKWVGAIHEVLIPQGFEPFNIRVSGIVVKHHKPAGKHAPDRNIQVLLKLLEDTEPNPDPRTLVYLGSEMAGRDPETAIRYWTRFIRLSGWDEEKYQAQHHIADLYRTLGKFDKAIQADYEAIQIKPDWPDAYFGLAETNYRKEDYLAVVEWTKAGSAKAQPETMLIINPLDYTYFPLVILGLAYTQLGDFGIGLDNFKQAYEIKQDESLKQQIIAVEQELWKQKGVQAFLAVRELLGRFDEWKKVRQLYDCVPKVLEQHPLIQETWQRSMRQTAHIADPSRVREIYADNNEWVPVADEVVLNWKDFPRSKFAVDVAKRIHAKKVVDWGSSDGFTSTPIALEGIEVVGFDVDPRCAEAANKRAQKFGVPARYEVGNFEELGGVNEKADLALLFEVLEHQVDPNDTLRKIELSANHVAITTPYLSWEGGRWPEWDSDRLKPHIRIFDQYDLERLLTPRGRIWNLYREPWGGSGWLFADYEVGAKVDKQIHIIAGGTVEEWNPRSLKNGLGGSETAVVRLTEEFAKLGHRPIVYTNCDEPGYYNGVCYRDTSHYRPAIRADMVVAWRAPEVADFNPNTKNLVLWMHDTDAGDRLTEDRAYKFDSIVVLSQWHKSFMMEKYPFIPEEKFLVIGNGVDPERFLEQPVRDPNRVFYSSSPDRGLDVILEYIWPAVISEVPDAELHVYYGWTSFDKFASLPGYEGMRGFRDKMDQLIARSKNVVQHGRIPQDRLAHDMMRSSIWLYPTYFTETYCITAIEAQLAGAIPITNHLAALAETAESGIFIEGNVRDPEVLKKYAEAVVSVLKSPEQEGLREEIKANAPARSWAEIAQAWDQVLEGELEWRMPSTIQAETAS